MADNAYYISAESDEEIAGRLPRTYFISADAASRSLSVLISSRQCYMCRQELEDEQITAADPQDFMETVSAHCSREQDYLLPDTPMKESIFRVLLAHGNEPMSAEQISDVLEEKWAMTPFPRDTSPQVIQRLLDDSGYYCISPAPSPEYGGE